MPTSLEALSGFVASGEVPAGEERFVAADESEDAEYDALAAAAEAAVGLLAERGRRVVVVAEVADVDAAVPMDLVASVHADSEDVDPDAADLPELGWYAVQEIPDLLG